MSCRRRDHANLVGCNIGDVAVRGCSRGCCPYDDSQRFRAVHPILATWPAYPLPPDFPYNPEDEKRDEFARSGRTDLRWQYCGAESYKPKFICVGCRRLFKPFYDDRISNYKITRRDWQVRPNPDREGNEALRNALRKPPRSLRFDKRTRYDELSRRYNAHEMPQVWQSARTIEATEDNCEPLTEEEMNELKSLQPDMWWQTVIGMGNDHRKRCPGCSSKGVRVGAKFEVPAKRDDKGWADVEQRIQRGDDMIAAFEVCATAEDYNDMVVEAERRKGQQRHKNDWEEERHRRLTYLGLIRTQDDTSMVTV